MNKGKNDYESYLKSPFEEVMESLGFAISIISMTY